MKFKKKVKRPSKVDPDNPKPKKCAKMTTISKLSPIDVVLEVLAPHHVPEAPPVSTTEILEESDDGFDPLYTYLSPHVEVSRPQDEVPLERVECPSAEQWSTIKIKLKNPDTRIYLETHTISHALLGCGKTPNAEAGKTCLLTICHFNVVFLIPPFLFSCKCRSGDEACL